MTNDNQSTISDSLSFEDLQSAFSFPSTPDENVETKEAEEFTFPEVPTEEPKVEEIASVKEDVKIEEPAPLKLEPQKDNFYLNLLKKKLEKNLWEDVKITEGDKEFLISEMEDLTEEEFLKIEEDQLTLKNEDLKDKYIPIEGLTEEKRKILEIVKNGGDLTELFQSPAQLEKPFDESKGWDVEDERHQESIVYQHYLSLGNTENRAKLLLEEDKKEFILDSKAKEIVNYHQKAFSDKLEKINADLVQEKVTQEENLKKYKSELTKTYKEAKVPDHDIRKLVDLATKEVDGEYQVDGLFEKIMKDPKEASELLFFMADKEKYLQQKMLDTKVKNNISTMRTINRIPKSAPEKTVKEELDEAVFKFNIDSIPK